MSFKTSIGTPTANSYISIASADAYFDERYDSLGWLDIGSTSTLSSTTQKENLLIQSTREIDRTFRFYGGKENTGLLGASDYQNLEFPRSNNTNTDGDVYIIERVLQSTCEQALWIVQRNDAQVQADTEGSPIKNPRFSDLAYDWIKPLVDRTVKRSGNYPWMT